MLDGVTMKPLHLDAGSALSPDTLFHFRQRGSAVWAQYAGGAVFVGFLVGRLVDGIELEFRYVQLTRDGRLDGGRSHCEVVADDARGLVLIEHFEWATRAGAGRNVFVALGGDAAEGDART